MIIMITLLWIQIKGLPCHGPLSTGDKPAGSIADGAASPLPPQGGAEPFLAICRLCGFIGPPHHWGALTESSCKTGLNIIRFVFMMWGGGGVLMLNFLLRFCCRKGLKLNVYVTCECHKTG